MKLFLLPPYWLLKSWCECQKSFYFQLSEKCLDQESNVKPMALSSIAGIDIFHSVGNKNYFELHSKISIILLNKLIFEILCMLCVIIKLFGNIVYM